MKKAGATDMYDRVYKRRKNPDAWLVPALLQMNEKASEAASVGVAEDRIVFNLGEGARWKNSRRVLNA